MTCNLNGVTSQITIKNGIVTKKVVNFLQYNTFEREIYWYKRFNETGYEWSPKLIKVDPKNKILSTEYCGERISKSNAPVNWELQLERILGDLAAENVRHNDIKWTDLLVKGGKLYLIDYGWMSIGTDWSCGGLFNGSEKPVNKFPDEKAVERIGNVVGTNSEYVEVTQVKKLFKILKQTFEKEKEWAGEEVLNEFWKNIFF